MFDLLWILILSLTASNPLDSRGRHAGSTHAGSEPCLVLHLGEPDWLWFLTLAWNVDQRPVELSIMHFPFLELDSQPRPVESESHDVGPRNVHFKYTPPCPLMSLMHVGEPLHRPSKYDSTSQMCGTSSLRGRYCVGREGWEKSVSLIASWEGAWGPGWKRGRGVEIQIDSYR